MSVACRSANVQQPSAVVAAAKDNRDTKRSGRFAARLGKIFSRNKPVSAVTALQRLDFQILKTTSRQHPCILPTYLHAHRWIGMSA